MIRSTRRPSLPLLALLLIALGVTSVAVAAGGDPIKARQEAMEGVGESMKALSAIAKKQAPFAADTVQKHGASIAAHLETAAPLFPEGSAKGAVETWAKAEIWANKADFDVKMKAGHDAALELAKVGEEAAFMPALGKLGNTCKSCHESFRRPKE